MSGLELKLAITPVGPRAFTFDVKNISDAKIDCVIKITGDKPETHRVSIKNGSSWNITKDIANRNPQMQVEYGPPNSRATQYA